MPRAKKTPTEIPAVTEPAEVGNPHVATTEPDTAVSPRSPIVLSLTPGVYQVEVEAGEDGTYRVEPIPGGTLRTIAGLSEWGQRCEEAISEKDDRIADLEAELAGKYDADQAHTSALNYRRGLALDDIRCAILDTSHPLGDDTDPELTPLRLVKEVLAKFAEYEAESQVSAQVITALEAKVAALESRPASYADAYDAVVSGRVKLAEWTITADHGTLTSITGEQIGRFGPCPNGGGLVKGLVLGQRASDDLTVPAFVEWANGVARGNGWTVA